MLKIKSKYDVIIMGSGPSGCACAIRCAQLGFKTLCIDNLQKLDNQPITPGIISNATSLETVALLNSAKHYDDVLNNINTHGIYVDNIALNIDQLLKNKDNTLNSINHTTATLFSKYQIDFIHAKAILLDSNKIILSSLVEPSNKLLTAEHIILATESIPISIACAPIDNKFILDSSAALNLNEIPKRLAILGAGVIGLELGGIWNRLGSETILLDAQESFLGLADHQISRHAYKIFSEQGLELGLGARVISTKLVNKKVLIEYQDSDGTHAIRVDKLIVASGRKPNSDNIAAASANLLLDENGYVHVNENFRTNLPGVYAIGDLTMLGPMLAHKGMAEGVFVAEYIAGHQNPPINYNLIPNVIFTDPEIAWVGQTEQTLKSIGHPIKIADNVPMSFHSFLSSNSLNEIIKVISCATTDNILGVHMIGRNASDVISQAVIAMEFSASSEDLAGITHAHPSSAEFIRYACSKMKNL
jgi:dihydrolipoamide dehydrogenase